MKTLITLLKEHIKIIENKIKFWLEKVGLRSPKKKTPNLGGYQPDPLPGAEPLPKPPVGGTGVTKPPPAAPSSPVEHSNERMPEPPSTGELGKILSVLWKPVSDTDGFPVVVVGCDDVPAEELYIEISKSDSDQPLSIRNNRPSFWGAVRGNQLPGHKYGRMNFKMKENLKYFTKAAPIRIRFFQYIKGQKQYLPIMKEGKYIVVKNPKQRLDLK